MTMGDATKDGVTQAQKDEATNALSALEKAWHARILAEHDMVNARIGLTKLHIASSTDMASFQSALMSVRGESCW
jgi:cell division GTPase FtsZ